MSTVSTAFNDYNVKVVGAGIINKLNGRLFINSLLKNDTAFLRDANSQYAMKQTISIPKQTTITSATRDYGSDIAFQTPTVEAIDLSLSYVTYNATSFNEFDEAVLNQAFLDNYITEQADSIQRELEAKLLDLTLNDSNVGAGQEIGTPGTALNYEAIVRIQKRMLDAGVGADREKILVVNPTQFTDLLLDEKVRTMANNGDNSRVNINDDIITFGQLRLTVINSLYLPSPSTSDSLSGSTGHVGVAMTNDSGILATRNLSVNKPGVNQVLMNAGNWSLRMTEGYDLNSGQSKVVWEVLWGYSLHRPETVFPILGGL